MFLPSQLAEIAQRFQPDVEDLRVFLQEEGLPAGSGAGVEELANRLNGDPRFRRDVAFLVRSMLGRERGALGEPGSMDVLGALVVAAGGTGQEFETPARQQMVRELLRFVIQQRRPAAVGVARDEAAVERRVAAPATVPFAGRPEEPSVEPVVVPDPAAMPSLVLAEEEPGSRRVHAGWFAAVLVLLIGLGAGLVIWRGESKPGTREVASAPAAPLAAYPADSASERRIIVPRVAHPGRSVRKARTQVAPVLRHRAESVPAAAPRISLNKTETSAPVHEAARPGQPLSAGAVPPPDIARPPSAPGSTEISNPFAHPEAAAAAADSQGPMPEFHPRDPVLIARNKIPGAPGHADMQGTVHTGSTGNMASNLMYSPDPEYPAEAIAGRVTGEVTVRVIVGPSGNVIDARVVSGPPLLREAALDAVGRWRYRPYEQEGKPVAMATTAIFDFQLPTG